MTFSYLIHSSRSMGWFWQGSSIKYQYPSQSDRFSRSPSHRCVVYSFFLPSFHLRQCITAAGLSFLAFVFGLCGLGYHRAGTIIMTLVSALALLITLIVWVIDMVLFGVARNKYRDTTTAAYGNATWFTLGALIALLLGFCTSACGVFGRYRKRHSR